MRRWVVLTLGLMLMAAAGWATDWTVAHQEIMDRMSAIESNAEGLSEAERLSAFIDLYFDYAMLEFPEFATYLGIPGDHSRWSDNSLEALARRDADRARGLEILRTIDRSQLEGVDRLNYDLLLEDEEEEVAAQRFLGEYLPITQMNGVQQNVAQLLSMMPARNLEQYENILSRLEGVPTVVDQTLVRLDKGLAAGVTPPKVTLRDVPDQVRNQIVEDPMTSPMLEAFNEFPEAVSPEDQERLKGEAVRVYSEEIVPAFEKLHDYLVETYLPGCREAIAMSALPDGEAWYAHNVKSMTTTDLTPQQIHDIGLSEVKRIRAEMESVKAEAGFEGSLDEFFDFLRTDPQFFYTEGQDLLTGYRDIAKRVDAELPKLFGHLPRLPYGVSPVPAYSEKSQTTAYYQPGSVEGGRSGTFFANTYDLPSRPKWEMEALTLHEAVPGHHFQIAIAQELDELPWFRRYGGYTAYVEGWGLYAESLGEEMGFYQDPYLKFGQLTYEMWRAIRLVSALPDGEAWYAHNVKSMTTTDLTPQEIHDIVVEVDRYIV